MKFFAGFVVGIVLLPLAAFLYLWLGFFPVATSAGPLPGERWLAALGLRAAISRSGIKESPVQPTEANLQAGAKIYRDTCAVCHGLPGEQKTKIAAGMSPTVPQLFKGNGVTDDPVGDTYWKVTNGIRLTGMPGFEKTLTDEQRWQVSEFLKNANQLPAGVSLRPTSQ
jgi:mono/diheme cytochrome c family protein